MATPPLFPDNLSALLDMPDHLNSVPSAHQDVGNTDSMTLLPPNVDNCKDSESKIRPHSNITTMEPFRKEVKQSRRPRYRLDPTLVHFDHLFGAESWSRFLVLKTSMPVTAAKLEHVLLSTCASRDMSFRPINRNEWLIETTTKTQSEMYQSLNQISGIDVTVSKHDQLNSIQGTVVLPQILNDDGIPEKLTILGSLQKRYPNVQDIEIYEIKQRKDPTKKLRIAKIKFEGQELPQDIKIEGQKRKQNYIL